MSGNLYVIGLTGNIATGKSVVAGMLAGLGAEVIDADLLAHQTIRTGTPPWQRVVEEFGADILGQDGEIDRGRLGALVFADPAALARLESIVHPAVIAENERLLQEMRNKAAGTASDETDVQVVVVEAIKLIESGMHQRCDEIWVVACSREQQLQRLTEDRELSHAEAELRIGAQPPPQDKIALADVVIHNTASLEQTRAQVGREWERIMQSHRQQSAPADDLAQGGYMSSLKKLIEEHPFASMWAALAVGMVIIFLLSSRETDLLPSQRLFMGIACVLLAGLCTWIISWE